MHREPFTMVCYCDFAGQIRGKGFPARDLQERWSKGVGWTPTNIMINCFGAIPATPWGAGGDLVLRPDPAGEVRLDFGDGSPIEHFILGDVEEMDGSPWECCPRSYLKSALAELRDTHKLSLRVAFEHEFTCLGIEPRLGAAYGLDAVRAIGDLPEMLLAALEDARLEPDTFLPEYSPGQYEVTLRPAPGLEAADRAVKLRQIVRLAARHRNMLATFSPILGKGAVGNGVHIHFSLEDLDGTPRSFDPDADDGVSEVAGRFVEGILHHGRALSAIAAPTAISYERLRPNAWSASSTNLGKRDREALVRICPVSDRRGDDVASSFNFEYRGADAAANPYLALGAIARAGLDGLARGRKAPVATTSADMAALSEAELARRGIARLPKSLGEALDCLEDDKGILMPDAIRIPYLMHKRGELGQVESSAFDTLCTMYSKVY
ncbi:MAG: glutamine synthetase [Parvibaculaceae bacterium]